MQVCARGSEALQVQAFCLRDTSVLIGRSGALQVRAVQRTPAAGRGELPGTRLPSDCDQARPSTSHSVHAALSVRMWLAQRPSRAAACPRVEAALRRCGRPAAPPCCLQPAVIALWLLAAQGCSVLGGLAASWLQQAACICFLCYGLPCYGLPPGADSAPAWTTASECPLGWCRAAGSGVRRWTTGNAPSSRSSWATAPSAPSCPRTCPWETSSSRCPRA